NYGASSAFRRAVSDATKQIPEFHKRLLGFIKIYTAKNPEAVFKGQALKQMEQEGTLQGGFTLGEGNIMGLIENYTEPGFLGFKKSIKTPINVEHVTLHEVGHMMDVQSKLSDTYRLPMAEALKSMTPEENAKADYFLSTQHEAFAELYAAAFAGN